MSLINELVALRNLERTVQEYCDMMGYSAKRDALLLALAGVGEARMKDESLPGEANCYGELLRGHAFVGEGLGCYSNFDTASDFVPLEASSELGQKILKILHSASGIDDYVDEEDVRRSNLFVSDGFVLAWYWDGDGVLLVGERDGDKIVRAAVNDDCKKDYCWKWVRF